MLRIAIAAAFLLPVVATAATAPAPAQNRSNAAVSGSPSLLLSGAAGQSDLCIGIQSAAYGSPMIGVTLDLMHTDKGCARIRKAKALQLLGYPAAAAQVLCRDPEMHAAMAAAGTPCESVKEGP